MFSFSPSTDNLSRGTVPKREEFDMRPIEVLLGVLFPIFIAVGIAMAASGTDPLEFTVARVGFWLAAIDIFGLVVWWFYKHNEGIWQYIVGIFIVFIVVILLPIALRWIDAKEAAINKPVNFGVLTPKSDLLFSSEPRVVNRSIEIGNSGLKFGSFDFHGNKLVVELIGGKAKVSSDIRDETGNLVAQLIRNEWQTFPPAYDRNYNDYALEVKNSKGRVVLQVKVLPDQIQIQGEWWDTSGHGWRMLEPPEGGMKIIAFDAQTVPDEPAIKPLFLYPSSLHFGELAQP